MTASWRLLLLWLALAGGAAGQSVTGDAPSPFLEAWRLHRIEGRLDDADQAYRRVVTNEESTVDLRARATIGLGILSEERGHTEQAIQWLASVDGLQDVSPRWRAVARCETERIHRLQQGTVARVLAVVIEDLRSEEVTLLEGLHEFQRRNNWIRSRVQTLRRRLGLKGDLGHARVDPGLGNPVLALRRAMEEARAEFAAGRAARALVAAQEVLDGVRWVGITGTLVTEFAAEVVALRAEAVGLVQTCLDEAKDRSEAQRLHILMGGLTARVEHLRGRRRSLAEERRSLWQETEWCFQRSDVTATSFFRNDLDRLQARLGTAGGLAEKARLLAEALEIIDFCRPWLAEDEARTVRLRALAN